MKGRKVKNVRMKGWKEEDEWKDERIKDIRMKEWKDEKMKEYLISYTEVLKLGKRWLPVRSEQDLFTETVSGTSLARATTPKYQSPVLFWIWSTPINQSTHSTNKSNIKGIINVIQLKRKRKSSLFYFLNYFLSKEKYFLNVQ